MAHDKMVYMLIVFVLTSSGVVCRLVTSYNTTSFYSKQLFTNNDVNSIITVIDLQMRIDFI